MGTRCDGIAEMTGSTPVASTTAWARGLDGKAPHSHCGDCRFDSGLVHHLGRVGGYGDRTDCKPVVIATILRFDS